MKRTVTFLSLLLLIGVSVVAQVGINTDNNAPDPSAMLDVKSANKGLLPPRVALGAINSSAPVASPAVGLLIYNTASAGIAPYNVTPGYYCWNGTMWIPVAAPQGTSVGDMLYWNGTQWTGVPVGVNGQVLTLKNGVPAWSEIEIPVITTLTATTITPTSATCGGIVNSEVSAPVTARGVCWSTTPNPTTANNITIDGSGTGSFTSNITGLTTNTLYYVRAYGTGSNGTSYGNQVIFSTLSFAIGQSYGGGTIFYVDGTGQNGLISATGDQSINSAAWGCAGTVIGGTGTAIGNGLVNTMTILVGCSTTGIAARICYDLVLNGYSDWYLPSKDELNQMYLQKNVIGGFTNGIYWCSSEIDNNNTWGQRFNSGSQLSYDKSGLHYVRAIRAFSSATNLPNVATTAVTNLAQANPSSGGNVISDGGMPVTTRGICWSTSSNPTTADSHTSDGNGTGIFVSSLTNLTAGTLYYVRAYASNNLGTSYGNQVSFTTSFAIGMSYHGGIIFYVDETGQHGLIAATTDQSSAMRWFAGTYTHTMAISDGIGAGKINTALIIANQGYGDGAAYAARLCNEYTTTIGGYTYGEWYLPSKFELNLMFVNLHLAGLGGFAYGGYWSSNEEGTGGTGDFAWGRFFGDGTPGLGSKGYADHVRAVRIF